MKIQEVGNRSKEYLSGFDCAEDKKEKVRRMREGEIGEGGEKVGGER